MDVNARIVLMEYINQYLNDILLKQLFLQAKNAFLPLSLIYFGTIFGDFYGKCIQNTSVHINK